MTVFGTLRKWLGEHLHFYKRKWKQPPDLKLIPLVPDTTSRLPPMLNLTIPVNLQRLPITVNVKGRLDYELNELVFVSFITEKGLIIKEFGIVSDKVGDQYIVKLLIPDLDDT